MSDSSKDPAIKLFGKTIQLPDIPAPATEDSCRDDAPAPSSDIPGDDSSAQNRSCSASDPAEDGGGEDEQMQKNQYGGKLDDSKEDEGSQSLIAEELKDQTVNEMETDELKTQSSNKDGGTMKKSEMEEANNSQEKALKKPDKILPCPRCNSMETKFCYFNNYNVNQPRHFCRNCQRYWTAGGTMRNVPVGAGRRKNKNSGPHYRHVTISEPFPSPRVDLPNGIQIPTINPNGTLLTFGSDTPLCESMASGLNIAEKTMQNGSLNGFHKLEELGVSVCRGDNGDDHSNGSSATALSTKDESVKNEVPNCPNFTPQFPCFPGAPWPPYPLTAVQWSSPLPCLPGFPMPIYPAPPYWGCAIPGPWSVPWVSPPIAPPHHHMLSTSGPNSPTLGKHSRDENTLKPVNLEEDPKKESNPEKCLWVPKTLRIDDPEDAAKSSIWATLGIKNDKADSVGGGLFKAFQSKDDEKTDASENSTVLQANPAALSRSLNFHENT